MKKKWILIVIFIVIIIFIFFFKQTKKFEYTNNIIPPTTYLVKINKYLFYKELIVEEYQSCSAVDCDGTTKKNKIILTDDEYEKIVNIMNKDTYGNDIWDLIYRAIANLSEDDSIMWNESDYGYELEEDLNQDGKVTGREFGNYILDSILKEDI